MMLRRGPSRPASVSTRTHRATQRPTNAPRRSAHSFFTPTPIEDLPPALRFPPTPPALKDVPAIKLAQRNLVGRVFNIPRSSRPVLLRVAYLINGQMQQHIRQPLWLDKLKLPDNFNTWFAVSLLHVWMVLYKTREDLFDGPRLQQDLVTVFWAAVEQNLVAAGITQGLIYSKYLTEYGKRYYGVLVAFDEAVQQGDVQLAEALWRNIFQMEITSAEGLPRLYNLVNYTRRQLHNIDQQPLDMITLGHVRWLPFDDVTIAPLATPGSSFTSSHAAPQSTPPPATAASAPHS